MYGQIILEFLGTTFKSATSPLKFSVDQDIIHFLHKFIGHGIFFIMKKKSGKKGSKVRSAVKRKGQFKFDLQKIRLERETCKHKHILTH